MAALVISAVMNSLSADRVRKASPRRMRNQCIRTFVPKVHEAHEVGMELGFDAIPSAGKGGGERKDGTAVTCEVTYPTLHMKVGVYSGSSVPTLMNCLYSVLL